MARQRLLSALPGALRSARHGCGIDSAALAARMQQDRLRAAPGCDAAPAADQRGLTSSASPSARCSMSPGCQPLDWGQAWLPAQRLAHRLKHDVAGRGGELSDVFVYRGPLSQAVKNLKRLSIGGCIAALLGSPVLVLGAAEAMPPAAQASIIATIGGFGLFTTGLLHWFTSPYVHRLEHARGSGQLTVETLSVLARPQVSCFHESAVRYPNTIRPQVTFEVDGRFFYLDADNFGDPDLLARLTPAEPQPEQESGQH